MNGGYQIVKDLNKISLGELMEFILGPVFLAKCLHKEDLVESPCEVIEHCSIMSPMSTLNRKLNEFYNGIKVGELLDTKSSRLEEANA